MTNVPSLYLVDDDVAVIDSLQRLVESIPLPVVSILQTERLLDLLHSGSCGCLLLKLQPDHLDLLKQANSLSVSLEA
ncbi:MAG: hypothetical protein ACIALR_00760, partial [Blastopirellula sp. JB062]